MQKVNPHSENTHQLHDDLLDQFAERVRGILLVQMVHQLRNHLRIRIGLEAMAAVLEERLQHLVVGDDAVVHDDERVLGVGALRMRVQLAGRSVRCPARMRNADVRAEHLLGVDGAELCGGNWPVELGGG